MQRTLSVSRALVAHAGTRYLVGMGALWSLGFRPFFLLGSAYAAFVMVAWLLVLGDMLPPIGFLDPVTWHSHEMVFGFACAIVAGFLLTASQNWTGKRGVHGRRLQAIVTLWALGRIALALSPRANWLAAAADLAFLPVLGALLFPYLVLDPETKMERVFYVFLSLLFAGNLLVHLDSLGIAPGVARRGVLLGFHTVIVMIVFLGGRVIPFFTEGTLARSQPKTRTVVEGVAIGSAIAFLVTQVFWEGSAFAAGISLLAASAHFARLAGWHVKRVRRVPLLWVLHVGYLWIVAGFLLSGLSAFGWIARGAAVHALAVGGIGVVIYGMTSRISLGHTGRRLHPSGWTVGGYGLLIASAVFRVLAYPVSAAGPGAYDWFVRASGTLWIAAFAVFLGVYGVILVAPRVDGKPG